VWNLLSCIKGRTWTEDFFIQGAEETVWPRREKVTGLWRQLNDEEVCDLYSSPDTIKMIV
jgi:hypothetical protein